MSTPAAKHTPGPWTCDAYGRIQGGENGLTTICDTHAHKWAAMQADHSNLAGEHTRAWLGRQALEALSNGQIISSAPDLLAALEAAFNLLHDHCGTSPENTDAYWAAKKAIDKAKGQS